MSKHTTGKKLVQSALGDSYYPDLGQSVSAERMIELIDSDPMIAAAPEMLEVLKEMARPNNKAFLTPRMALLIDSAIAKAEGK